MSLARSIMCIASPFRSHVELEFDSLQWKIEVSRLDSEASLILMHQNGVLSWRQLNALQNEVYAITSSESFALQVRECLDELNANAQSATINLIDHIGAEPFVRLHQMLADMRSHMVELQELCEGLDPESVDLENILYDEPERRKRINILTRSLAEMRAEVNVLLQPLGDILYEHLVESAGEGVALPPTWERYVRTGKPLPEDIV
jgi:hypothetical protein